MALLFLSHLAEGWLRSLSKYTEQFTLLQEQKIEGRDTHTVQNNPLFFLAPGPTGASSGIIDLLPSPSAATNWTAGLLVDSSEMIFKFDGRQGAKIPDGIVPKNLTDQFTITMWMKHGPSPGVRAEKETILCNSDKTGESACSLPGDRHRHKPPTTWEKSQSMLASWETIPVSGFLAADFLGWG